MAAEAAGFLTAEAEAVALPVAVEAVPTVIDKISASQEGPPLTNEAGLFLFSSPRGSKSQPTTLSSFACSMSSSGPDVSRILDRSPSFRPKMLLFELRKWGRIL
jgi:hypothetical protein